MIRCPSATFHRFLTVATLVTFALAGCPEQPTGGTAERSSTLGNATSPLVGASMVVWEQQTIFEAPDAAVQDRFGSAVSIQGDEGVVGAPDKAFGSSASAGAAYAFARADGVWKPPTKITAATPAAGDRFATSVSLDGTTVVAGAPGRQGGAGAVDVFVGGGPWTPQTTLVVSNAAANDGLGSAVHLSADTVVAGAPNRNGGRGAVDVFVRTGTSWAQQAELVAADGAPGDAFGAAVALDGDTVIVGAPSSGGEGAAYLFVRSNGAWSSSTKLAASDAASGDAFGTAVSIAGGLAAVGAPGKELDFGSSPMQASGEAYVFAGPSGSSWTQQASIVASDGAAQDQFGSAVAIAGGELAIGAPGHANGEGEVYLFTGAASVWTLAATPQPDFLVTSCLYGSALALDGATLVVGEPNRLYDGFTSAGQAPVLGTGSAKGKPCSANDDCAADHCVSTANGAVCCDDACNEGCGACSASGTCTALTKSASGTPSCDPFVCDGASIDCPTVCAADAQCAADAYCGAEGVCQASKSIGATCNTTAGADCAVAGCRSCAGAGCFDAVCCDATCGASCEVCRKAIGASADGTCTVASPSSPGSPSCAPFACNGVSADCPVQCTGDTDCAVGTFCNSQSRCVPQRPQGTACQAVGGTDCKQDGCRVCASGFCTDDVCCNADCRGQCQSCAQAGSVGACAIVAGTPVAPRPACAGAGACQGSCDGVNGATCTYPGAATTCGLGACAGDSIAPASSCDGTGGCASSSVRSCGAFTCDSASSLCFLRCTSDAECAAGATCDTSLGQCAATTSACSDAYDVRTANGQVTSCRGYACVAGQCRSTCAQAQDCAPQYACSNGACVADGPPSGGGSSGCGCKTAPGGAQSGGAVALAVAGVAFFARRRRRERR